MDSEGADDRAAGSRLLGRVPAHGRISAPSAGRNERCRGARDMSFLAAFGRFWWDFIVGDSIVLAIGGVAILLLAWAFESAGLAGAAEVALPLAVLATLWVSLPRS